MAVTPVGVVQLHSERSVLFVKPTIISDKKRYATELMRRRYPQDIVLIRMRCGCLRRWPVRGTFRQAEAQQHASFIAEISTDDFKCSGTIHGLGSDLVLPYFFQSKHESRWNSIECLACWI